MKIKLADIILGKNWSRTFGVGDVSELAASMQEHGQITPVIVDENNNLVAGFRRYAAANQLGWNEIDARVCVGDPRIVNLIENMNREGLSLWEEIQGIRDVFGPEATVAEISRALSKSRTWVNPRVAIWDLPKDFQDKVRMGHSGLKEINKVLTQRRGPSAVSKNIGVPTQPDIKHAVSMLMSAGREVEARALSFACGTITQDELLKSE